MSGSGAYSALKGIKDIFPPDIYIWQNVEMTAKEVFSAYGFQEIRPPVIERTEIFTRSIGETTDIVEKEMYTFQDKAGRSITLRPEGTASVVRAYIENSLYTLPAPQKFFYSGPMFRYERPQKGRFRQFYQIGVEAFGAAAPEADAEMLSMLKLFFEKIGLKNINFEVNSIGCHNCRPEYKKVLISFFSGKLDDLCPDCKKRYDTNPLRILDCKVESCTILRNGAPQVTDFLCPGCRGHFEEMLSALKLLKIPHLVNSNMVRGLDYYTRTAFEVTSEHLGAQKAVAAGGRYDRLVEEFGGPETPAIGFAIGMERLVALLKEDFSGKSQPPRVFIAALGKNAVTEGLRVAEDLRQDNIRTEANYTDASLKSQLRKADRLGAEYVIIIGDDELKKGLYKWKKLADGSQGETEPGNIRDFLNSDTARR